MTSGSEAKQNEIANQIRSILNHQVQSVLATQDQGVLYQHLMAYSAVDDLSSIYLASFDNTQKVRNIRANPNVSLLWDNRTGNNKDHTEGFALSAHGSADIVNTGSRPDLIEQLRNRNDSLTKLLNAEQSVLIVINIKAYQLAIGYTQTMVYEPR